MVDPIRCNSLFIDTRDYPALLPCAELTPDYYTPPNDDLFLFGRTPFHYSGLWNGGFVAVKETVDWNEASIFARGFYLFTKAELGRATASADGAYVSFAAGQVAETLGKTLLLDEPEKVPEKVPGTF